MIDLTEQLALIQALAYTEFWKCIVVCGIMAVVFICCIAFLNYITKTLSLFQRLGFWFCIICVTLYAGSKSPVGTITFPRTNADMQYLINRGSYVTNDYIHVDFTTIVVPSSANLYGAYRQLDLTNDTDWVEFVATTIEQFNPPQDIQFASATNYNFVFYTDWSPQPAVHTNGVLTVGWGKKQPSNSIVIEVEKLDALPIRTSVIYDGKKIATPEPITGYNSPTLRAKVEENK